MATPDQAQEQPRHRSPEREEVQEEGGFENCITIRNGSTIPAYQHEADQDHSEGLDVFIGTTSKPHDGLLPAQTPAAPSRRTGP